LEFSNTVQDSDEDLTPTQLNFNRTTVSTEAPASPVSRRHPMSNFEHQSNRFHTLQDALREADEAESITYQDIVNFLRMTYDPAASHPPSGTNLNDDADVVFSLSSAVLPLNENSGWSTRDNSPQKCETISEHDENESRPASPTLGPVYQSTSNLTLGAESTRGSLRPYLQPAAAFMARDALSNINHAGGPHEHEEEEEEEEEDDNNDININNKEKSVLAPEGDHDIVLRPHNRPAPSSASSTSSEAFSFVPSVDRIAAAAANQQHGEAPRGVMIQSPTFTLGDLPARTPSQQHCRASSPRRPPHPAAMRRSKKRKSSISYYEFLRGSLAN
jgi:hypothetical protein